MSTEAPKTPTRAAVRGCYVYGIVRDDLRPRIEHLHGVADAPIALLSEGGLAAVVADVSSDAFSEPGDDATDAAWLEAAVRAHEGVLEGCLTSGPVLPMRFATTFRTEDDVRDVLRERKAHFESELARFRNRSEWGVKAIVAPTALMAWARETRTDVAEKERELEGSPPGTAYFAHKRLDQELSAEGENAAIASLRAAHEGLSSVAEDARLIPAAPKAKNLRLNAAYLVARDREHDFRATLDVLGREHAGLGIRYDVSGPWPPYNFVTDPEAT